MIVPSSRKLPAMTYPIQSLLQLNVPQVLCLWRLTWLYLMAASILKQSTALVVSVRKPPQGKKSPEQDGIKEKRRLTDCFIKGKVGSVRGCTSSVPIFANGARTAAFAHLFNHKSAYLRKVLTTNPLPEAQIRVKADGSSKPHLGVDLGAEVGTYITAAGNGTIQIAQGLRGYGNAIYINHGGVSKLDMPI